MAQIGQFTRDKSGFTGRVQTLLFTQDLSLVPAESSDAENAPDYRVHVAMAMARRSARAGSAPARRPASMSHSSSTIPHSRSRSAPTSSSRATTSPSGC